MRHLKILYLISLFAFATSQSGCASDTARAQTEIVEEPETCDPTSSRILEGRIQDALDESGYNNVTLLVERADGRRFRADVGTPNERYISSSTSKPVMASIVNDQIARRRLTLNTRVLDVLPSFPLTGAQRDIEVRHLLNMTSGIVRGPDCSFRRSWAEYVTCVESLPAQNPDVVVPGERFHYSSRHLDVLALMVVQAGLYADWQAAFDEWRTNTGLFPGAHGYSGYELVASSNLFITAAEQLDFMKAVRDCSILPNDAAGRTLCAQMQQDQIPNTCARGTDGICRYERNTTSFINWREDWHFGFMLWMECPEFEWSCPRTDRVSTLGVGGQYAVIDREHDYFLVVSVIPGGRTDTGYQFAASIQDLLNEWAALSR